MKKAIEVANVVLVNDAQDILFLQRSQHLKNPGLWCLPGGMVDDGETPRSAAGRELHEETGISEARIKVIDAREFLVHMPEEDVRIHSYLAALVASVTIVLDPAEHTDHRWTAQERVFETDDLLPCVPSMIAATLAPGRVIHDRTITGGVSVALLD